MPAEGQEPPHTVATQGDTNEHKRPWSAFAPVTQPYAQADAVGQRCDNGRGGAGGERASSRGTWPGTPRLEARPRGKRSPSMGLWWGRWLWSGAQAHVRVPRARRAPVATH